MTAKYSTTENKNKTYDNFWLWNELKHKILRRKYCISHFLFMKSNSMIQMLLNSLSISFCNSMIRILHKPVSFNEIRWYIKFCDPYIHGHFFVKKSVDISTSITQISHKSLSISLY